MSSKVAKGIVALSVLGIALFFLNPFIGLSLFMIEGLVIYRVVKKRGTPDDPEFRAWRDKMRREELMKHEQAKEKIRMESERKRYREDLKTGGTTGRILSGLGKVAKEGAGELLGGNGEEKAPPKKRRRKK